MITFSPLKFDDQSLRRYESLFFTCFSKVLKFEANVLKWLYVNNPAGFAVGFDAYEDDELAAHYVCIPVPIRLNGKIEKALLSLNTATHPRYQGKGLFTKLAEMTYQTATDQGFDCVYGVANANSTPGFTRKLGFQLVQSLNAKVGIGSLGINFQKALINTQFERVWTPELLKWRCGNPGNQVSSLIMADRLGFHANAFGRILPAYAELPKIGNYDGESNRLVSPFRLFLGLVPEQACNFVGYANISQRLRPSPLNLIFRPLVQSTTRLEAGHISFSFLDFDAY